MSNPNAGLHAYLLGKCYDGLPREAEIVLSDDPFPMALPVELATASAYDVAVEKAEQDFQAVDGIKASTDLAESLRKLA